jgi:hypothetical protein
MNHRTTFLMITAMTLASGASAARADSVTLSFHNITNHGNASLVNQLHVTAAAASGTSTYAEFTFTNSAVVASSIMQVYFADGTLLGIAQVRQAGASLVAGNAVPADLPGGSSLTPAFHVTQGFLGDAGNMGPIQGVDSSSDYVTFRFNLINGRTFANTMDALRTGALRIGVHVTSIGATHGDDSYVNNPTVIPLPPGAFTGMGTLAGVFGLGLVRRIRRNR